MQNPLTDRLLEKAKQLSPSPYITLTAIHPTNRAQAVPSRHILATDIGQFNRAYERLMEANQQGWGAYIGIGYRKRQLSRYQRGGKRDILALPALFADIDRSPDLVLPQLKRILEPSLVISSGRGVHLYWVLATPTGDIVGAARILKGLARWLDADVSMSVDQVLRLPLSQNTKPLRQGAICSVLMESDCEYELDDFLPYEILMTPLQAKPQQKSLPRPKRQQSLQSRSTQNLNPDLAQAVLNELQQTYSATLQTNGWYACFCPFGHKRDRFPGDHAYYHPDKGLFNCFGRHGQHLIHSIATQINIDVNTFGGIYTTDNS